MYNHFVPLPPARRTDKIEFHEGFLSPMQAHLPLSSPPAVRTSRRTLGRNVSSMLVQNYLIPNLLDERSHNWSDDDTLSIVESNLDDSIDVFWIDGDSHTAEPGSLNDSAMLLPQTIGDPTNSVIQEQLSEVSIYAPVDDPEFVFGDLTIDTCQSNVQTGMVALQHNRRCHSTNGMATLPTDTLHRERH